jgi:hypothetical protein
MQRHLPEPAPFSRLRKSLAALPPGMPTSLTWVLAAAAVATPIITVRANLTADGGPALDHEEQTQANVATHVDRGRQGWLDGRTAGHRPATASEVADPGPTARPRVTQAASPGHPAPAGGQDRDQDPGDGASPDPALYVVLSASASPSDAYMHELGQLDQEPDAQLSMPTRAFGDRVDEPVRELPWEPDLTPVSAEPPGHEDSPGSQDGPGHEEALGHGEVSDDDEASDDDREADHHRVPGPDPAQPAPTEPPEDGDD